MGIKIEDLLEGIDPEIESKPERVGTLGRFNDRLTQEPADLQDDPFV